MLGECIICLFLFKQNYVDFNNFNYDLSIAAAAVRLIYKF